MDTKIKESRTEIKRQNRTAHAIHYYTDSGRKIAFFLDDRRGGPSIKTLYFNTAMMAVPCYDHKSKSMNYIQRAKLEYQADFREIETGHPGIPQSEFDNF